jgi:seryl-tRNA synthetase
MNTAVFSLDHPLEPDLAEEIEKQSVYVAAGLRQMAASPDRTELVVKYEGIDEAALRGRVERFVASMLKGFRPVAYKVVRQHQRRHQTPFATDVFANLVERGWVIELGPGQVALAGPALALTAAIERKVAQIGRARFDAVERAYPTLIPASALARCGYIDSFPQHLSVVLHMHEDFDAIDRFRRSNTARTHLDVSDPTVFADPKACLCPALCYHCYPSLAGRRLPSAGHVETAIGRVARYESANMVGLDRLWEFTQRSIIWLGEEDFCNDRRERSIDVAMELAEAWDVDCTIETANDPFFASVATAKSFWQRAQDLKFELRVPVEPSPEGKPRTVAAASFNLHGPFFGNAFDIRNESGEPAFSGCACWGLERWVLAIFTQHGFDLTRWPAALRAEVLGAG